MLQAAYKKQPHMKFSETKKIARPHLYGLFLLKLLHFLQLYFKAPNDICINIYERESERGQELFSCRENETIGADINTPVREIEFELVAV